MFKKVLAASLSAIVVLSPMSNVQAKEAKHVKTVKVVKM